MHLFFNVARRPSEFGVSMTIADCLVHILPQDIWARFLSLSQTCLRTVLDGNNLLSFLAETIWFSVAVLATRS